MKKGIYFLVLLLFISTLVFTAFSIRSFGAPPNSDMDNYIIENGQEETGANNIISGVVYDYRGFDTLGEVTVLFTASIAFMVLIRRLND
ncbi:hypothetical protein C9439_04630 [archaeon SCG-AAA382B04]|nr:hypothetical protein C9439_04630 [archaeon SCG-AAA382B04]